MVKPLGTKVIIERDKKDLVSESGLHIPESYAKDKLSGVILNVGPGTNDEPMRYCKGEHVYFDKNVGMELEVDGKDCILIEQGYILFVQHSD